MKATGKWTYVKAKAVNNFLTAIITKAAIMPTSQMGLENTFGGQGANTKAIGSKG
jgi:hypothetical protein